MTPTRKSTIAIAGLLSVGFLLSIRSLPVHSQIQPGELPRVDPTKPNSPPEPNPGGCADRPTLPIPVDNGVAQFELFSPCRKGELLAISANELNYEFRFDANGRMRVPIPLFNPAVEIVWKQADGTLARQSASFAGINSAFEIALIWLSKVELSLHVLEGARVPNGTEVRYDQATRRAINGLGTMRVVRSDGLGANVDLYALPLASNPRRGIQPYRVEFASRGTKPAPPYCGPGDLAAPVFVVWILRYGRLDKVSERGFASAQCGTALSTPTFVRGDANLAP